MSGCRDEIGFTLVFVIVTYLGVHKARSRKSPAPDSYPPEIIISTFFRILPAELQSSLTSHMLWFLFPLTHKDNFSIFLLRKSNPLSVSVICFYPAVIA